MTNPPQADDELREQIADLLEPYVDMYEYSGDTLQFAGYSMNATQAIKFESKLMQLIHKRDERREQEIEAKFRMDNIYAIGGITDYQIILYKDRSEVMRTPIYDIHTLLIAQGTTNQLPTDVKEEG